MNLKKLVGSLGMIFLSPCAGLAIFFEQPLVQLFLSDPIISFLYSNIFPMVVSSTEIILRRILMDASETRLIYYWNGCCNLAVIFIVVMLE